MLLYYSENVYYNRQKVSGQKTGNVHSKSILNGFSNCLLFSFKFHCFHFILAFSCWKFTFSLFTSASQKVITPSLDFIFSQLTHQKFVNLRPFLCYWKLKQLIWLPQSEATGVFLCIATAKKENFWSLFGLFGCIWNSYLKFELKWKILWFVLIESISKNYIAAMYPKITPQHTHFTLFFRKW